MIVVLYLLVIDWYRYIELYVIKGGNFYYFYLVWSNIEKYIIKKCEFLFNEGFIFRMLNFS